MYNVFCYGSNSVHQLRERVGNQLLEAKKAFLPGYIRIFAGKSKKWKGGVASLQKAPFPTITKGSIVLLTEDELSKLDMFEGACKDATPFDRINNIYRRQFVFVIDNDYHLIECIVYIKNNKKWMTPPSQEYIIAIQKNIHLFWENDPILVVDHDLHKRIYNL